MHDQTSQSSSRFSAPSSGDVSLTLTGPAGTLEAVLHLPEPAGVERLAVICHPHPLHGGTMNNKVVHYLGKTFNEAGFATVKFNFRGVNHSQGTFNDGMGETEDVLAVHDWARQQFPKAAIWLAGFSFGAFTAFRASSQRPIGGLVLVAPPVGRFTFETLSPPPCPWLVVQGDQDELVDCTQVVEWTRRIRPRPTLVRLKGVDHFFHGRLNDLRSVVRDFLSPRIRAAANE